ncbi:MAG: class I SAM-dependent methyltransferase [Solirubrobacterales bacterium]|nr:class I SAM-dependent methyltransferase [Solirubrobacterales bacterium]
MNEGATGPGGAALEPGSFRDPDGRVLISGEEVYRALSETGLEDWRALADSPLFGELTREDLLVGTGEVGDERVLGELRAALPSEPAMVLRHERVPFISYPYEWSFSMLRDAALLQLDLNLRALDAGLALKDATPYNVQWRGAQPLFIDVSSFERLREGEPWAGYRQFCELYLYQLMLQAYRGFDLQPLLRGSLDGITPGQAAALLRGRDVLRRGVITHVKLHARLQRSNEDRTREDVKGELKRAQFKTEVIRANLRGLQKLVGKLRWRAGETAWTAYRKRNSYEEGEVAAKQAFVREAAAARHRSLVWDLGCNDGAFARIAAESSDYVVAVDFDHATIDALYRSLAEEGSQKILPLVGNLLDPSPGLGWRGAERRPMESRGTPDLVLALALVHHLSITGNVPIADLVDWMASLGATLVVEFPTRDDPMVTRLLAAKREGLHADYELATFERLLGERFELERREQLDAGTRVLFLAQPRR